MRLVLGLFLAVFFSVSTALAQDNAPRATLVADTLRIEGENRLVAEGAVEVFYEGARLTASRVEFDRATDSLRIEGPIRLSDGEGAVLLASSAELDRDLSDGLLRSARLVLDQQLQLAAAEIARTGDRYTRLRRVVASSCEVCEGETPLWEIRASGVVHDQLGQQLYFSDAQLRVAGIPIFFIPRLRLPDPTLDRATGFLIPDIRTTSDLSTGIKVPYFIRIGDTADLTLTPYLSPSTRTLEARYRQAFRRGRLQFDGAFTGWDDILGQNRGYAFLEGGFLFPREFRLEFDLEYVSDRSYGLDYGYFDKDRLDSELRLSRTRRDDYFTAALTHYETLREADIGLEDTIPRNVGEAVFSRRVPTGALGGTAWASFDARTLTRPSPLDGEGRDVGRIGVGIDWRRDWILPQGLIFEANALAEASLYSVKDDSSFASTPSRLSGGAGVSLRWPLLRQTPGGARQMLEPVLQVLWTNDAGDDIPNEDSALVEFDEGNLFSFSRYPGGDAIETGARANIGVNWRHVAASGLSFGITAGRVIRLDDRDQFATGTGLSGSSSDWLAAFHLRQTDRFSLINRSLFDNDLAFTRNETRLDWLASWGLLSTSYLWALPIPEQDQPNQLSEWSLEATYAFNRNWQGSASWRYNFEANRAARAGLGLRYVNECVDVGLSVSRRFTSSSSVTPTTDFRISLALTGFGSGSEGAGLRQACSG